MLKKGTLLSENEIYALIDACKKPLERLNQPRKHATKESKNVIALRGRSKPIPLHVKKHTYAMRWKIETFHKILKSGCNAEESRLRMAERLTNLISVFCIISWRIFWLTMLNRTYLDAEHAMALTPSEIDLLNCLVKDSKRSCEQLPLSRDLEKMHNSAGTSLAPTIHH